jgi:hypothetical protein
MNLNLGCGYGKLEGWINVDSAKECAPDLLYELECLPWPWESNSAERVCFIHSLEHMGREPSVFLGIMQELYRVCCNGAEIEIVVPHPRHDNFLNDPTHVRVITPGLLQLFDRRICDDVKRRGGSNSPLAHYLNVDFAITSIDKALDEPYFSRYASKLLSDDDIERMSSELNNVISQYRIFLLARK